MKKLDEVPILLIENKENFIFAKQKKDTIVYFDVLKKQHSLNYIVFSARKVLNVNSILTILQQKCLSLLNSNYFVIYIYISKWQIKSHLLEKGDFFSWINVEFTI